MSAVAGATGPKYIITISDPIGHYRWTVLEKRKVQLIGGSTYIVSLPKKWVKKVGIRKSSDVALLGQRNGTLVLVPEVGSLAGRKEESVNVSPRTPARWVARSIISKYLNGSDRITVVCRGGKLTPVQISELKKVERKLVGLETVEESESKVILESMLKIGDLEVWKGIARTHMIASLMQKEAIEALISRDPSIAENAIRRDDDVDRLYFLGLRQLRQAASNPAVAPSLGLTPIECLDLQSVIKRIEHIADHAQSIAVNVKRLAGSEIDREILDDLARINKMAQDIHEGAGKALTQGDLNLANSVVNQRARMKEFCSEFRKRLHGIDVSVNVRINAIVESLERIADYGTDIAEVAINRSAAGCANPRGEGVAGEGHEETGRAQGPTSALVRGANTSQ